MAGGRRHEPWSADRRSARECHCQHRCFRSVALRTAAVFRVPMMTVTRGPPRLGTQCGGHHVVTDDVSTVWSKSPAPTPPRAIASLLHENGMDGTAPHPPAYVRPKDQRLCLRPRHGLTGFTGACRRVPAHTVLKSCLRPRTCAACQKRGGADPQHVSHGSCEDLLRIGQHQRQRDQHPNDDADGKAHDKPEHGLWGIVVRRRLYHRAVKLIHGTLLSGHIARFVSTWDREGQKSNKNMQLREIFERNFYCEAAMYSGLG